MNKRRFLKTLASAAMMPLIPSKTALAALASPAGGASIALDADYKWAEILVRAHKTSSAGFLARHLKIGPDEALRLHARLIQNGVISAQQNAYGLHRATKPLWDEYAPSFKARLKELADKALEKANQLTEINDREEELSTNEDDIGENADATNGEPFSKQPQLGPGQLI